MLRLLRAAVSRNLRPTTLLLRVQPTEPWDDLDFDLLSALDRLETDTSDTTGLPWWLTRTGHPGVDYEIDTVEDAAEAALGRYDEKQGDKKAKPGVHRFAVPKQIGDIEIEGGLAREAMLLFAKAQADGETDDPELSELGVELHGRAGEYDASLYG